jgi:hypothetical protein
MQIAASENLAVKAKGIFTKDLISLTLTLIQRN